MSELDPKVEAEMIHILAGAQEELMLQHLRPVAIDSSPSADVEPLDYGYAPMEIGVQELRPSREPVHWRSVAAGILGLEVEAPFHEFSHAVVRSATAWDDYLQERFGIDDKTFINLKDIRKLTYRTAALTEDNLPAYKSDIHGAITPFALPADLLILDRSLGIWIAEEDGHLRTMDAYGEIVDLTSDRAYWAARNSLLRTGSSATPEGIISIKVYTAVQERLTEIAHRLDAMLHEPVGAQLLMRISKDESRHHDLFRKELALLAQHFPDEVVLSLERILNPDGFMPGSMGIPRFFKQSIDIAQANLLTKQHFLKAFSLTVEYLGILAADFLATLKTDQAKSAADRMALIIESTKATKERRIKPGKFVLGQTITLEDLRLAHKEFAIPAA